jgi:glycosyltransferase involved in cell wall biosynthesis
MASIDVVIPCYQYGRFLRDCVASILDQGIDDLRILIIDNASVDDSVAVARQLAAEDRRIEVVARVRNLGHHASFNQGVDWARADYFAIVCADDLLTPGSFLRAVSFMEQHPEVGFTIGKEIIFHREDDLPGIALSEEARWRIFSGPEFVADRCRKLFAGPVVARTAVQKQAGHYREALYFTCDIEMLWRLATFCSVGETTAPQGYRRVHGANLGNVHEIDRARALCEVEAAFASFFEHEGAPLAQELRLDRLARRNLVESAYWFGVRDLTKGRWRTGVNLLRFAFARSPQMLILPPIGFLFEKERALHRLAEVARGTVRSRPKIPKSS